MRIIMKKTADFDKKIAEYTQVLSRNPNDTEAEAYKTGAVPTRTKGDYARVRTDLGEGFATRSQRY
jgi:hypothetical protein